MAGSAKNRKPLSQKRQDLLNSIGFNWVGGVANQTWGRKLLRSSLVI